MLLARGATSVGKGSLRWTVFLGSHFWGSIIQRSGLALDTRFVPASTERANTNPCIYLLARGEWRTSDARSFTSPHALVVSCEHLDGADGARPWTYRAAGDPFSVIELHLDPAHTSVRAASAPVPIDLTARSWSAALRVVAVANDDDRTLFDGVEELLRALAQASLVSPGLAKSVGRPMATRFQLLWKAIGPMIERLELRPTVKEISTITGATTREVDRFVRAFLSSFGFVGGSWREASRHWRLKLAVLFLSAEDASIAEIARAVGYGSADAMARAFRDAALPAPSVVQEALKAAP